MPIEGIELFFIKKIKKTHDVRFVLIDLKKRIEYQ